MLKKLLTVTIVGTLMLAHLSCAEKHTESESALNIAGPADLHGPTSAEQQKTIDELVAAAASKDYSAEFAEGAVSYPPFQLVPETAPDQSTIWLDILESSKRIEVKREGLSDLQKMRLSSWTYKGMRKDFVVLSNYVGKFVNDNGRLPAHGEELFKHIFTADDAASFQELDEAAQVSCVSSYIDPLTGRFWDRFDQPEWRALGVSFRRVPDEETVADFGGVDVIGTEQSGCALAFQLELTLWGEEPGEVLFRGKTACFFPPPSPI